MYPNGKGQGAGGRARCRCRWAGRRGKSVFSICFCNPQKYKYRILSRLGVENLLQAIEGRRTAHAAYRASMCRLQLLRLGYLLQHTPWWLPACIARTIMYCPGWQDTTSSICRRATLPGHLPPGLRGLYSVATSPSTTLQSPSFELYAPLVLPSAETRHVGLRGGSMRPTCKSKDAGMCVF